AGRLFFGNLMGMCHVMILWPFPAACFLKCFNKGSLNVLCCARVSSPHITSPCTVFYHMYTSEVKTEKSKRKIPAVYGHEQVIWIMVLSLKDASLGEESTLKDL
uniref:Uncharacterized protein n=1 Tax=Moschus moschiferus TaxID=68415 RepID=A0A8C6DZB6_MOSMO